MYMHIKMRDILSNIGEGYNNSGGDFDVLHMIENARKKYDLDSNEVEYLKMEMSSAILAQKRSRGESVY